MRRLCSLHLGFALVYIFFIIFVCNFSIALFPSPNIRDALVGLYCYFAFQYPFLYIFFGQAARGFSLNICVSALKNGGKSSEEKIFKSYGDGRGIEHVKNDRLDFMMQTGVANETNGAIHLNPSGRFVVHFNRVFLRFFNLNYIGITGEQGK